MGFRFMAKRGIGYRAYEECLRIFKSVCDAADAIGVSSPIVIYRWQKDFMPSAVYLAKLYEVGADIGYIFTGKKEEKTTVDSVEMVHGRWIESTNTDYMMSQYTCSECGGTHIAKTWSYCPDCGAKMDIGGLYGKKSIFSEESGCQ
jgi:hypothetical protein